MKRVFVDSLFLIARARPDDQWHRAAMDTEQGLGQFLITTTDEVLIEFLNALSEHGEKLRKHAVETVRKIMKNANIEVVPQSRQSFTEGLVRYENRGDKGYSLTDRISMNVMEEKELREVLTGDHHFVQEGFIVLMKEAD